MEIPHRSIRELMSTILCQPGLIVQVFHPYRAGCGGMMGAFKERHKPGDPPFCTRAADWAIHCHWDEDNIYQTMLGWNSSFWAYFLKVIHQDNSQILNEGVFASWGGFYTQPTNGSAPFWRPLGLRCTQVKPTGTSTEQKKSFLTNKLFHGGKGAVSLRAKSVNVSTLCQLGRRSGEARQGARKGTTTPPSFRRSMRNRASLSGTQQGERVRKQENETTRGSVTS